MDKHAILGAAHAEMAFKALAHYHGAWWGFLRYGAKKDSSFTPEDARTVYTAKFPMFIFKDMVQKTFKSVAQLLKNRKEPDELVQRVLRYSKDKAVQKMGWIMNEADDTKSK